MSQQTFPPPYTSEEETWLVGQFNMFDRAYHELELGEDAFKDIMNHSLGVPISRYRGLRQKWKLQG